MKESIRITLKQLLGARTSRPHSVRSTLGFVVACDRKFSRFALSADETSALPAIT
ncbi:MAG TPA: hypothetical protein VF333_01860 [Pyrinomonadaceae bacterium]